MQLDESFFAGASGGGLLIGALFAVNCLAMIAREAQTPAILRTFLVHVIAAPVFALLGGTTAYFMSGRTGDFFQGLTWLALVTVMAGGIIPGIGKEEASENSSGSAS
jgi:hypothetical protein